MLETIKKRKLKFLTVVWGERYVEEFAQLALPSFIAPGNIPALARRDFEILILTTHDSRPVFERQKAFHTLSSIAPIRFIDIDDLVVNGLYGVTLTYAYARGIMESGEEQINTTFVFMNADFVLADGSLTHLLEKIDAGHPAILAASLRVCSEQVLPQLHQAVDQSAGFLSMPSRQMVGIALEALHPTVIGKMVTQGFVNCVSFNQFYWQVDEATLLGRYHLIFMLAISPEQPLRMVNFYCDYGFVPEMVPSGQFHVIGDSDDYFMLELAPGAQESELIYCGRRTMREMAQSLSFWTTKEQRAFATKDTVFHARDLPPNMLKVRAEADNFVMHLQQMMQPEAVSHVDHYYWTSGLTSWMMMRQAMQSEQAVPSFDCHNRSSRRPFRDAFFGLLNLARRFRGIPPLVALWHHLWVDGMLALDWARRVKAGQRKMVIGDDNDAFTRTIAQSANSELRSIEYFQSQSGETFDAIFLHVLRKDIVAKAAILNHALSLLAPGGELTLFVEHRDADTDSSNFTQELAQYVLEILPRGWMRFEIKSQFVGGLTKRRLRQIERLTLPRIIPTSLLRVPMSISAIVIWSGVAVLTAFNNILQRLRLRWNPHLAPVYCSSAVIHFRLPHGVDSCEPSKTFDNGARGLVNRQPVGRIPE